MPSMKRIAVTTVSAIVGYQVSNMVLNATGIQPADTDYGFGMFEFIESAIITASVLAGNSLV
jgi:hypothetical protein